MWSKGLRCKRLVDDQAGFMADMSSLTFQMHGTDNNEEFGTQNEESQAGQQAASPERMCEVTLVKTGIKNIEKETRVRAETLATSKFGREKFWPKR